jgi:hypothetical protein
MKLNGKTPVGAFDFVFTGAPANTQSFVIVAFSVCRHRAANLNPLEPVK